MQHERPPGTSRNSRLIGRQFVTVTTASAIGCPFCQIA
ncbi:hypothetical protein THTE_4490 [Thermogutta terrifontis]|uniref:Uncharacterized protein n=1 Tax=Thermogutta terrifontis TaxID=1331910 RepID=A0A286RMC1_9BACT|nr:hypothetical protein THTE_4490 [Thermogutta terrifontis]